MKSEGLWPFSTVITRMARAMLELTTLMTPWAAASTESPIGSAICFFMAARGQLGVDFQPAAQYVGIDPPQHQIGVGDHGLFIAQVIGYRPGIGARALWPHLQCARVVDVGDGPPPAPTAWTSIMGTPEGRPHTLRLVVYSAIPSFTSETSVLVPPYHR